MIHYCIIIVGAIRYRAILKQRVQYTIKVQHPEFTLSKLLGNQVAHFLIPQRP